MKKSKEAINQQQIDEWKAQYGKIYKTVVGETAVIWRKLRRKEYVSIMSEDSAAAIEGDKVYARQEMITKAVALYPENVEELIETNAGLATCIADEVILNSGFNFKATEEL